MGTGMKKKRAGKKSLIGKWAALTAVVLTGAFLLTGCSSMKLAEGFDEQKIRESAQQAVQYMSDEDLDSLTAMFREDLKELLPAEVLQQSIDKYIADRGAFQKIKSLSVIGQKNGNDEDMGVAVAVTEYENQTVTYTVAFDRNMNILAIYMK